MVDNKIDKFETLEQEEEPIPVVPVPKREPEIEPSSSVGFLQDSFHNDNIREEDSIIAVSQSPVYSSIPEKEDDSSLVTGDFSSGIINQGIIQSSGSTVVSDRYVPSQSTSLIEKSKTNSSEKYVRRWRDIPLSWNSWITRIGILFFLVLFALCIGYATVSAISADAHQTDSGREESGKEPMPVPIEEIETFIAPIQNIAKEVAEYIDGTDKENDNEAAGDDTNAKEVDIRNHSPGSGEIVDPQNAPDGDAQHKLIRKHSEHDGESPPHAGADNPPAKLAEAAGVGGQAQPDSVLKKDPAGVQKQKRKKNSCTKFGSCLTCTRHDSCAWKGEKCLSVDAVFEHHTGASFSADMCGALVPHYDHTMAELLYAPVSSYTYAGDIKQMKECGQSFTGSVAREYSENAELHEFVCDVTKVHTLGFTIGVVYYNQRPEIVIGVRGSQGIKHVMRQGQHSVFNGIRKFTVDGTDYGKISSYMWMADQKMWAVLGERFEQYRGLHPEANITTTGHSLGGALASIFALRISASGFPRSKLKVITFGQPKVGDKEWTKHFNRLVPHHFRVTQDLDVVVSVPGDSFGYVHTGHQVWYRNLTTRLAAQGPEQNTPSLRGRAPIGSVNGHGGVSISGIGEESPYNVCNGNDDTNCRTVHVSDTAWLNGLTFASSKSTKAHLQWFEFNISNICNIDKGPDAPLDAVATGDNVCPAPEDNVGPAPRDNVGPAPGDNVGPAVKDNVGPAVKDNVGTSPGDNVGPDAGDNVGPAVKDNVGTSPGDNVGPDAGDNIGASPADIVVSAPVDIPGSSPVDIPGNAPVDNAAEGNVGPSPVSNAGLAPRDNAPENNVGPSQEEIVGPSPEDNVGPSPGDGVGPSQGDGVPGDKVDPVLLT